MDFPGGSITNIHAIEGFSTIYWRIYTEEPAITSHSSEGPANGHTILKHLSRLKDLEIRLRGKDCLVSCYPRRLGLWVFSATPDFDRLLPLSLNEGKDEQNKLLVGSITLKVSASGNVSSRELVKNLSTEPQALSVTPAGPRPQNVTSQSRRAEGYGSAAAIYASFITAITGTISLQLIQHHGAVPLGSRTLFTAVERDGYESPTIANNSPTSSPSLTTLQVQFTPVGKLTVAFQTIAQHGLSRIHSPKDNPGETPDAQPGLDVWLSPNGAIARLISVNTSVQGAFGANSSNESSSSLSAAKRLQWKQSVVEWLKNFGLPVDSHEEELWVEVETWEPFYARLAGEIWRQNEENSSALPLKRILWPARYCFRRTKSILLGSSYETHDACHLVDNPLDLAEEWHVAGKLSHDEPSFMTLSGLQEQPSKEPEILPTKNELPDAIESLSRIAQYPDIQSASLVYPTPPDGGPGVQSDALTDFTESPFPQKPQPGGPRPHEQAPSKAQAAGDPDITMDFGPSAGLVVGSGLYDMNGEDDLFGEIDDKDFGAKGITDADFSFFDDPEFENMGETQGNDNIQSVANTTGADLEEVTEQPGVDNLVPEKDAVELTESVNEPETSPADNTVELPQKRELPDARTPSPREENSQPISPPLSPVEVKKILFPGSEGDDQSAVKREGKQSHYTPVAFKQNMGDWNQKYGADGRFWFSATGPNTALNSVDDPTSKIPTIGLPRRGGRNNALAKPVDGQSAVSGGRGQRPESITDSSSTSSDEDSDEIISSKGNRSPVTLLTRKRKRGRSASSSSAVHSPEKAPIENIQMAPATKTEDSTFLGNFLSSFSDWSLIGYFSASQNQLPAIISRKDEQIQVAQLLVDQTTQSSLDHKIDGNIGLSGLENEAYPLRVILEDTTFAGEVDRLDLKSYASLQNEVSSPSASQNLTPRQLPQRKDVTKESISKLPSPHLRIRRGKDYLEALPPTISFWETFDLEPSHGPKDVSAYCIHPQVASEAADAFLERLGLLYSSCNLGGHVRGDRSMAFERGLGSWSTEWSGASGYVSTMQSLWTLSEDLGTALSNNQQSTENFVVYVINPFTHAAALADICAAFWQLFRKYVTGTDKQQSGQADELVLQIIPMGFVMSPESIVVPPQSEYLSLALEVYSRCPPRDVASNFLYCAPPVLLAEPAPRNINFRLASEKSSPLQDGKSLHIACSKSLDQRWITVAWSDNTGIIQRTMSYCLRSRSSSAARNISDVRSEIWSATQTILDRIQARWRIIIVNTDPVDQEELDTWTNLAEQRNKTNRIPLELVILHINPTPDLFLEPSPLLIPMSVFNAQTSSTPDATPSAASPDQSGNTPTPTSGGNAPISASTPEGPLETESEFTLTDVNDESWAVILSHRLNSSPHLTEYRPALASGYLLRRKGPTDGDGVFATTANLVYAQRPPPSPSSSPPYESLLKEILGMYNDLGILARIRGTQCVQRNALPWHIATAIKAQELLSYVF